MNTISTIVDEVFLCYERSGGAEYYGEDVTQLEHMSQSAALAIHEGHDDEVILAAFFHDIGHICVASTPENQMNGLGIVSHEKIGADFIRRKGFPERVARLVEYHVQAKRYLTYKNPDYFGSLSEASRKTLELQGGVMTEPEAREFEADPLFETSIRLRRWDELAKETSIPVNNIEQLKEIAKRVLESAFGDQ